MSISSSTALILTNCAAVGSGAMFGALTRYGITNLQNKYKYQPWVSNYFMTI